MVLEIYAQFYINPGSFNHNSGENMALSKELIFCCNKADAPLAADSFQQSAGYGVCRT